jgi:hypothetical protein
VRLDEAILIDFNDPSQKPFFYTLFPYRLKQLEGPTRVKFLEHQLHSTFSGNRKDYRQFLNEIKASSRTIIGDFYDLLNQWITDELSNQKTTSRRTGRKKTTRKNLDQQFDREISGKIKVTLKDYCNANPSKICIEMAAKTLNTFLLEKVDLELKATDLTKLFIQIGILTQKSFKNYSDYLRRLENIKADPKLKAALDSALTSSNRN